jgi:xylulokinase
VVFATTTAAFIEPEGRLHAFCHPDRWHFMGVMLSAAGSEGLQFLPYLSGERTPHADPLVRAAWVGLTLRHGRNHLTRAILEGVAFGLKDSFELIKLSGLGEIRQIRISGGGAKSALWREILASVFEVPLVTVDTLEGAAHGAALLAAVGAKAWISVPDACSSAVKIIGETRPNLAWADAYRNAYTIYKGLYPQLKPSFKNM